MFGMVDLKISNLQSVREAFFLIGVDVQIIENPEDVTQSDVIILPGVGAFEKGMTNLQSQDLQTPLYTHVVEQKKPIIGFCLGMQLLAQTSTEYGQHQGLGFIRGRVIKLELDTSRYCVPNMGWCEMQICKPNSVLFNTISDEIEPIYYFAHSYHMECDDPSDIAGAINLGTEVVAAIEHENIFGLQFHPEKSQTAGLEVLNAFCHHIAERV